MGERPGCEHVDLRHRMERGRQRECRHGQRDEGVQRGLARGVPVERAGHRGTAALAVAIAVPRDVADLRRNTQYGGVYAIGDDGLEHPSVAHFWKVMESLPDADRRKVLKFVTSTPRGPLLGFANLNPRFSIRDSSSDEGRIPTASTCVNLLKLPMYKSERALREKLLYALNSGAGFDLS